MQACSHLGAVVQDEHAVAVERGQARGAASGRRRSVRSLSWSASKRVVRDDRLLVDQVALERGQHLLIRDVHRPHDDEPGEHERVGRQALAEEIVDGCAAAGSPPASSRRAAAADGAARTSTKRQSNWILKWRSSPDVGVGRRQDQRIVDVERHAVVGAQDSVVGVEEAPVGDAFATHVHPSLERAVGVQQEAAEVRGRVNGAELEGDGGGHVVAVPGAGREDPRHQHRDQLLVLLDDRQVVDRPSELGRGLETPAHGAGDIARDAGLGGRGFPRGDQRVEAQLAPVREGRLPAAPAGDGSGR